MPRWINSRLGSLKKSWPWTVIWPWLSRCQRLDICGSTFLESSFTWDNIDVTERGNLLHWIFVPCLSLMSIWSYVVQSTKETGNIYGIEEFVYLSTTLTPIIVNFKVITSLTLGRLNWSSKWLRRMALLPFPNFQRNVAETPALL